ncbi:amidophosphoribosyltransferase [Prevotella sp. khp1]|uniref:amidophosphoribosyltransferase n=1 Tax=Prevotellaceae TaxID=171552 RepID=UPI0008899B88|nr:MULTISPECIES: amidophosphoribosyltransferase [Prevotellaceae]QVJ80211.1 amidophosphoribosyltransferase [Xylanibacter ruminicola]SDQ69850.1 amidophosphoribosyltransferase [Prevotella sp. khp1]
MEQLKHECGVAMIRLLKPLDYYEKKYGTWAYGFNKLYLMMEKQHNRGQEGAGIASVNLNNKPGTEYMFREKAEGKNAITEIFSRVTEEMKGELLMGHLRYSTTGKSGLTFVHPFLRRNNWRAKNLCLCGNFNMTNIDEVFDFLTAQGQSPRIYGDSYITLELMGHRLDREVERLYQEATAQGLTGIDITNYIDNHIEMANVLRTTMQHYDGGFVMCGLTGSGEMFSVRDPWGIRPAFYYRDDEIIALASERPVLQTTFDIDSNDVHELLPGQALIVHKNGESRLEQIMPAQKLSACSFERIYFSRGSDCDIYQERKRLGEQLTQPILKAIDGDVTHSVFSYIPNTAEVAFYGMTDGFRKLHGDVRTEKVVWKDIKLRTFITDNSERNDLAAHVYDISYGSLQAGVDNLVIIDDSIVRGTTLKESIFKILDRLHPKKIVMVSSSPQIRYPDYYGIDMARLEEFCAFRATMALIEERGMWQLVNDTYLACKRELQKPKEEMQNCVRAVYEPFTVDEINKKIVEMLRPADMQAPIELVFQSIEGLHKACPNHPGDWYFTGHYPTPGGVRLVNQAFINYVDKVTKK